METSKVSTLVWKTHSRNALANYTDRAKERRVCHTSAFNIQVSKRRGLYTDNMIRSNYVVRTFDHQKMQRYLLIMSLKVFKRRINIFYMNRIRNVNFFLSTFIFLN